MTARTALVVSLLAGAPVLARAHGRLALTATAGGGYASDVFIGAGLGPDGVAEITPAARLDLDAGPSLKLSAVADMSYGRYVSTGFTTVSESGGAEARWLASDAWEISIAVSGEHASYSLGAPLDLGLTTSPSVFDTEVVQAAPLARFRAAGLEWRAAAVVAARSSTTAEGPVPETDTAGILGILWPISGRLAFSASYKFARNESPRADFALTAHAGFLGMVLGLAGHTSLDVQLQAQTASFESASREDLVRLTTTLTHPLAERIDGIVTYSLGGNVTNDPARPSASRHFAFVGVKARLGAVEW